jgi:histone-binding protein RBBP4
MLYKFICNCADTQYSRVLEWPSLTCQWFPDEKENPETGLKEYRLLLGTNTSGNAQEQLLIARYAVPKHKLDAKDINAETQEIGGHGSVTEKYTFEVIQKINHEGEINKARYMPQNPDIIASMGPAGTVHIFDRSKHESFPSNDIVNPQIQLVGHEQEGFGLSWSPVKKGILATGSGDTTVRVWDITDYKSEGTHDVQAKRVYTHHTATVNDVDWHHHHHNILASVSDDLKLAIIDTREADSSKAAFSIVNAHRDAVNCVAWNPHPKFEWILATGSADGSIGIWDARFLKKGEKVMSLEDHAQGVVRLDWNPQDPAILTSGGVDRRINYWDISQPGSEQSPEEAEDGPPELVFKHAGFLDQVNDYNFSKHNKYMIAAVADDNQLQIFDPLHRLITPEVYQKDAKMSDIEE